MVDPATAAAIGEVLKDPKALGEGIGSAAEGIGNGYREGGKGVKDAAEGIGKGGKDIAEGIGGGFRESKIGDAEVERAKGDAKASQIEAMGAAEKLRLEGLGDLAKNLNGLPLEVQMELLKQATSKPLEMPKEEPKKPSVAEVIASTTLPGMLLMQSAAPDTRITDQRNMGAIAAIEQGQSQTR